MSLLGQNWPYAAQDRLPTFDHLVGNRERSVGADLAYGLFDRNGHRLAFIDDMDGKKLERLVAGDFESPVRHIANVDFGYAWFEVNWLAVGQHRGGAVDNIIGFVARMGVKHSGRSGRYFNSSDNDFHICAGQITLCQFASLARLSVGRYRNNQARANQCAYRCILDHFGSLGSWSDAANEAQRLLQSYREWAIDDVS